MNLTYYRLFNESVKSTPSVTSEKICEIQHKSVKSVWHRHSAAIVFIHQHIGNTGIKI